jgi:CDP-diacylglycerol--serine O-phosphatidyltransferase
MLRVRHRRTGDTVTVEIYPVHSSRPTRRERRPVAEPAALTRPEVAAVAPPAPVTVPAAAGAGAWSGAGGVAPAGAGPSRGGATPAGTTAAGTAPGGEAALLPGARTVARLVRFSLVTSCTLASLSMGVLAILLAMRGDVHPAAGCLIACVVFDGLDGWLARRLGVASPFGAQMDSLADMCAFGIGAPVVVYAAVAGSVPAVAAAVACALVAGCAAIRLARFTISPRDSRFFTGVPTTCAAAMIALAVLVDLPVAPGALLVGVALLAFAMVSSFPYATLARVLRLPPWLWLAPLAGGLVDPRLTFVGVVVAYLASGPVLWLHRRRAVLRAAWRARS